MTNTQGKNKLLVTTVALGFTLARLPLAERIANKIDAKKSIVGSLTMFILADIADGYIARQMNADGPARRAADAAVDRLSVLRAGISMYRANADARPFLAVLAVRDAGVSLINGMHYKKMGEVVHGANIHKLSSLSVAAFAVGAATHNRAVTIATGTMAAAINIGLAADYIHNYVSPHGNLEDGVRHISFGMIPDQNPATP
jgi:phosphatidylglycerophosphate synthase